jgi:hypothetical protein
MSATAVKLVGSEGGRPSLRADVVAAGAKWSVGQRQLVGLVVELEISGEWRIDGFATCAHWVAATLDLEVSTVREWLRIGRLLPRLSTIKAAFDDGRLSYSKLRALARIATPENEAELCAIAERFPAGRLRQELARWLLRHETPDETEKRHHTARGLWWRLDVDGMGVGCFRLPPQILAILKATVDADIMQARSRPRDASADASDRAPWPTAAQQRADALIDLVQGAGAALTAEIIMHVRADGCTLDDGTPIAESVVERIAPHAFLRALIHDAESHPINASGKHRHPTDRQKRVVHERDGVCVDCGAGEFLQYDHDPDHDRSHQTVVDELWLRCWACHRARHRRQRAAA